MNSKKILIVDDDEVIVKVLTKKLQAKGYEVVPAADGPEAISALRLGGVDLILMDINFPQDVGFGGSVAGDGFQIMNWLRRVGEARNLPVIFMSSNDAPETKDRCLAAGAVAFFPKPLDENELLVTIRQTLGENPGQARR